MKAYKTDISFKYLRQFFMDLEEVVVITNKDGSRAYYKV